MKKFNMFVFGAGYFLGAGQAILFDMFGWYNLIFWTVPCLIVIYMAK